MNDSAQRRHAVAHFGEQPRNLGEIGDVGLRNHHAKTFALEITNRRVAIRGAIAAADQNQIANSLASHP